MKASTLRLVAIVLIVLALLLAGLAYMSRAPNGASRTAPVDDAATAAQIEAVVALKPLAPYKKITAEDVTVSRLSVAPRDYFSTVEQVVGKSPVRSVDIGSPVTAGAFSTPSALATAVPPGTEAISIAVSDESAVGGFVRPGDRVDVLIYIRASGSEVNDSQARILLRDVRLLAYRDQIINGAAPGEAQGNDQRGRTAVLAIPDKLLTRVMLGASVGELRLALRRASTQGDSPADNSASPELRDVAATDNTPEALSPQAQVQDKTGNADSRTAMTDAERQATGGV